MPNRDAQAQAVSNALAQWLTAVKDFDSKHAADIQALAASNAAFAAYNQVAWMTNEHSGATPQQKIDAYQKQLMWEQLRGAYDQAFAATSAASAVRNAAQNALNSAAAVCGTNPGESENMGGTIIGGPTNQPVGSL